MTASIRLLEVIFIVGKPRTTSQNFYFRCTGVCKLHFRFEGIVPKCAELSFRGSPWERFWCMMSVYDWCKGAINAHLRVAGSPEPARSVSVNLRP